MNKLSKYILYITAALVLLLAAASFYISYHALQAEAAARLKTNTIGAYVYPLVVDGATVAFSLWALWSKVNKQPEWYGKGLALAFTCVSIVANIKHAGILSLDAMLPEKALYCILAGLPPLGVFLALEALLHQAGFYVHQTAETPTAVATATVERKRAATPRKTSKEKRHDELLNHLRDNPGATYRQLRDLAGVSLSTIKKDVDTLMANGLIVRNGNGLEVAG